MKLLLLAVALATTGGYDPDLATRSQWPSQPDLVPRDAGARRTLAKALAFDAALYGTASVLQYRQMYAQAVDRGAAGFTGFNAFAHGRALAGPDYEPFKTPNADTLYSNAWLDLRDGPVRFEVPATGDRYYTASFLDSYANASNISTRTSGGEGGRFLIVTTDWKGEVPAGTSLFRVATPYSWILLRLAVRDERDVAAAASLQDRFRLTPLGTATPTAFPPPPAADDAIGFFRVVDFVLRANGHPRGEDALVHRFAAIGIGAGAPFEQVAGDPAIAAGLKDGYEDARRVIAASLQQRSGAARPWAFGRDTGRYGYNYLQRSVTNVLGTGANVRDENGAFMAFTDATAAPLDGGQGRYRLRLAPPPSRYFWSVTLYDARTRQLHPNPGKRYLVGDRTGGLVRNADGTVTISIQSRVPARRDQSNWLPAPDGPFYLVVRAQGPAEDVVEGRWEPAAVERIGAP